MSFRADPRRAEHGFTPLRRLAEDGFTLIEIMVALAVFGLAVLALVRLESATARGAGMIDRTLIAQMVAQTVANEAITDARPPVLGRAEGSAVNGGQRWNWTRNVARLGDGGVLLISVLVSDGRRQVLGRLTAIRPPERPGTVVTS